MYLSSLTAVYKGDTGASGDTGVGGGPVPVDNVSESYALTEADSTLAVNATAASVTITLPIAASVVGRTYDIKKVDSSTNTVTIDGNGIETIDGDLTVVLLYQYENLTIRSTGSSWVIL